MRRTPLAFVSFILLALSLAPPVSAVPPVGKPAPDFTLKTLDGEESYSLSEFRGRVVYVDFWASWCTPCRAAFPKIMELYREYKDRGFVVLGVNLDQKAEQGIRFMAQMKADFPSVHDAGGHVARKYGVVGIPTAVLVGPDGKVVQHMVGMNPYKLPQLKARIEELLDQVEMPAGEKKDGKKLADDGRIE